MVGKEMIFEGKGAHLLKKGLSFVKKTLFFGIKN